ncbi:hypothetical protein [Chelativorans sp. AA-79]|uniref:hypothetical protein n=1 Tax=Chelativorans sp. AA-79 TaxID=3028735 RepID=UPI0023F879CF|nr:hypothetical protein [Chelativorans sp. AA-79]WEX09638.1 hypothetical protein PVE73_01310 [Chelativorans sp. AA-79]
MWYVKQGLLLEREWDSISFGDGVEKLVRLGKIAEAVEFCLLGQRAVTQAMVRRGEPEYTATADDCDFKMVALAKGEFGLLVERVSQDAPYQSLYTRTPLPGSVPAAI